MLQILQSLRDFMDEETLKWLPGNIQADTFILLPQSRKDEKGVHQRVIHVFDKGGTYIGEISNPHFIPKQQ